MKKRLIKLIIVFLLVFICFLLVHNWAYPRTADPFTLNRLGNLASILNGGNISNLEQSYEAFPFFAYMLTTVHSICGLELLDILYLPIIFIASFFMVFVLATIFLHDKIHILLLATIVYIYVFIKMIPYGEYFIGCLLYPLFIYSLFKYVTGNHRIKYFIILLLIFSGIKFYAPPIEIWSIVFGASLSIALYISSIMKRGDKINEYNPIIVVILMIVIWLFINPKLYSDIASRAVSWDTFIYTIGDYYYGITHSGASLREPFAALISSPVPLKIVDFFYICFLIVPVAIKFILDLTINKRRFIISLNMTQIFAISLIPPFLFEFIVYASAGYFTIRYIALVFPFISLYFIQKFIFPPTTNIKKNIFSIIITALLVITIIDISLITYYGIQYRSLGREHSHVCCRIK